MHIVKTSESDVDKVWSRLLQWLLRNWEKHFVPKSMIFGLCGHKVKNWWNIISDENDGNPMTCGVVKHAESTGVKVWGQTVQGLQSCIRILEVLDGMVPSWFGCNHSGWCNFLETGSWKVLSSGIFLTLHADENTQLVESKKLDPRRSYGAFGMKIVFRRFLAQYWLWEPGDVIFEVVTSHIERKVTRMIWNKDSNGTICQKSISLMGGPVGWPNVLTVGCTWIWSGSGRRCHESDVDWEKTDMGVQCVVRLHHWTQRRTCNVVIWCSEHQERGQKAKNTVWQAKTVMTWH